MRERAFGPGEVDEHVRVREGRGGIGSDRDAARRGAEIPRVAPGPFAPGDVERGGERNTFGRRRRVEERAAHAAAGSRDRDAHRVHLAGGARGGAPTGSGGARRASPRSASTPALPKNTPTR